MIVQLGGGWRAHPRSFASVIAVVSCSVASACGNTVTTAGGQGGGATTAASTTTSATSSSKAVTATHAVTATTDAASTTSSGGFCDGSKVAGTCAQPFFAAVASCLSTLGSCVDQITPTGATTFNEDVCWSTGQRRHTAADASNNTTVSTWTSKASAACLTTQSTNELGTYTANGTSLVYDESTGQLSCPDGSTANIGVPGGDLCPDVDVILDNQCTNGTCQ